MADLLTILVGLVGGLTLEVVKILNLYLLYKPFKKFKAKLSNFEVNIHVMTLFPGWAHGMGRRLIGMPALLLPLLLVNL